MSGRERVRSPHTSASDNVTSHNQGFIQDFESGGVLDDGNKGYSRGGIQGEPRGWGFDPKLGI